MNLTCNHILCNLICILVLTQFSLILQVQLHIQLSGKMRRTLQQYYCDFFYYSSVILSAVACQLCITIISSYNYMIHHVENFIEE